MAEANRMQMFDKLHLETSGAESSGPRHMVSAEALFFFAGDGTFGALPVWRTLGEQMSRERSYSLGILV